MLLHQIKLTGWILTGHKSIGDRNPWNIHVPVSPGTGARPAGLPARTLDGESARCPGLPLLVRDLLLHTALTDSRPEDRGARVWTWGVLTYLIFREGWWRTHPWASIAELQGGRQGGHIFALVKRSENKIIQWRMGWVIQRRKRLMLQLIRKWKRKEVY